MEALLKGQYSIWEDKEYTNPLPGNFIPNIVAYIHEDDIRDAILIVPGGGYRMTADSEGEIVAKKFYEKGYNTFVLTYTTTLFSNIELGILPLKDIAQAMFFLRCHSEKFQIQPEHIAVCGFSAGGHLCGTLAVHWNDERICSAIGTDSQICRPNAVILSYPVITTGKYAHQDSVQVLVGEKATETEKEYFSVEKQITNQTPSSFIWHTASDDTVPVENSLLYEAACRKSGVSCEMHIFPQGPHGLSLADEVWALGRYDGDYTLDQWFAYMQYYIEREEAFPQPFQDLQLPKGTNYREYYRNNPQNPQKLLPYPLVAIWPELADRWLKTVF